MKKKKIVLLVASLLLIFTACTGKKADPAKVATAFIENTIYYKDNEDAEKYFYQLAGDQKEALEESFKEAFSLNDEQSKELVNIYSDKLATETSFSTKVIDDESETKTVEVTIVGLDQSTFEQTLDQQTDVELVNYLQNNGHSTIKQIEDTDSVTDEEELNKLADTFDKMTDEDYAAIQYEALKQAFQSLKADKENKQKVQLKLKPDEKEKKYWQVEDEEQTFNALLDAFQG